MNSLRNNHIMILTMTLYIAATLVFLTFAQAQQIEPPFREDVAGTATNGIAIVKIAGMTARATINRVNIIMRADNPICVLSPIQACPFTIELLNTSIDPFNVGVVKVEGTNIRNREPIHVTLPISGIEGMFNAGVQFHATQEHFVVGTFQSHSFIFLFSLGESVLELSEDFTGSLGGHNITITAFFVIPLVNRPPIARATSETVNRRRRRDIGESRGSGSTDCSAAVLLDGRESMDPDGNLSSLRWFDQNGTFIGEGAVVETSVQQTGTFDFQLVAEDDVGGLGIANTAVNVPPDLFGQCDNLPFTQR
jgi:hypothetical protein